MDLVNPPSIALVCGYLPSIDPLPDLARRERLFDRLAIAIDSHREDCPDMVFEGRLAAGLLRVAWEGLACDEIRAIRKDRQFLTFPAAAPLLASIATLTSEEMDLAWIQHWHQGNLVALTQVIPYMAVGGPFPYHDSWTFSIFLQTRLAPELLDRIAHHCQESGIHLRHRLQGHDRPRMTFRAMLRKLF